ncbi:hypothetical protein CK203_045795 [Vitis vinifera]|uniref:Uncharacterized protein n=1 Tax=Vitis vinifera TaxID=29760 RepID=A0A438FM56_VITVI|nr:hypothetical protein CK203_045795 [Vitis vinifera]
MNPLPTHITHTVPPPIDNMHSINFVELDDHIHMLSWDESEPEPIVSNKIYDDFGPTDTSYVDEVQTSYVDISQTPYVDDTHTSDMQYVIRGVTEYSGSHFYLQLVSIFHHSPRCIDLSPEPNQSRDYHQSGGVDPYGDDWQSHMHNNGSALNVYPLATAIALGYVPSDFGPSTQTVQAYDNARREVMDTLEIELLIGSTTFVTIFQVLRIPTSFNLLLGRPWIHKARAIPFSLHEKISHSDDDLLLTGFTFDEVQALEMEDFCRDFMAMSFDQHDSTMVLDMMRSMSYLPGMGLG